MFISPALEELTDSVPEQSASVHDQLSVQDSAAGTPSVAGMSQQIESFEQELSRQLSTGIDQQKFQHVKQAIQSVVNNYGDSADLKSVIQVQPLNRVTHQAIRCA